jgi:hypothetical protein
MKVVWYNKLDLANQQIRKKNWGLHVGEDGNVVDLECYVSEKHNLSTFRAKDGGVRKANKVSGNCSAQFRVKSFVKQ